MTLDLIHAMMACTFFALWAMIGHIAVSSRRSRQEQHESQLPVSGDIGQR